MADPLHPLSPLESALADLAAADRAGVFARTRLDSRTLMRDADGRSRALSLLYRFGTLAAMLGVAVCLWVWRVSDSPTPTTQGLLAIASPCDGTFFGCVTGPRRTLGNPCSDFDYDADGDIDMLDIRAHQLRCDGITR